ncbi:MAG: hypothetical protein ACP5R3_04940 [Thermoplasmata archaeon]|nr:hypothetical protein [Thermoplasmata archaeon]
MLKFFIGIAFLAIASYQDIREREITAMIWIFMGITSAILLFIAYSQDIFYVITILAIFFLWFLDIEKYEKYLDILSLIILISILFFTKENLVFFVDGILIIFYKYLYNYGILGGKADARAIMAITLLNPFYPELFLNFYANRSIVSIIFPYSLEVLFYAVIINAIVFIIYLFFINIKNGAKFLPKKIFTHIYSNGEWIKYQTPFILSILIAFIISYFFDLFYLF